MRALANTKVSILTGTSVDSWGDTVDGDTVSASGIPASLIERSRLVTTPEQPTPRVIRFAVARLPSSTVVGAEDRIRDERTGTVYAITAVTAQPGVGHTPDLRLDLKRVT
jgi:hypothetical protein